MKYLDTNQTTQYNSKLFTNIEKIKNGMGAEFMVVIGLILVLIFSIIISFILNWKLSLIMSCIIPIVIGSSLLFAKLITKETEEQLNSYSKAGQIAQEVFSSLRTVLSFNGSKCQQKQYEKESKLNEWCTVRKDAAFGAFFGWLIFINFVVYSIGFTFGSILMSYGTHHRLTISDILIVVNMFAQALSLLISIGPLFQSISEAQSAAVSVFRLIDEVHDENLNEKEILEEKISDEKLISNINGDIEFDNVTFSYTSRENVTTLNNLKLIARVNQTIALVGSSGCGKSSFFLWNKYNRFNIEIYYNMKKIMIDGQSITDYKIKQFRQNIGVVSQEHILFGISIYENIRFGKLNATRTEIEQAAEQANAHKFIMKLPNKYETIVGERGIQLSGGEKQRIALARAPVKQPNILLFDEATSALDNVSEKIVQEALDRACKNRTTIVIAHRLTTIQNADYIYVLDKANFVTFGIAGAKFVSQIRSKAFGCFLRQEVAYLDRSENSPGAICNQLSSNAAAIEDMVGTRLCVICQALAMSVFGLSVEVINNMRTVKQLSMENEVLQQYSNMID
ncbi:unnamed protein product [Adineta steineri]|uniref:Uncharacterized protein n=1 Tax=Adineta steineri TaxID=433720 RepID=A0A815RKU8_9BILA|nr:unnamed protein product [Adineta steineri]CAF1638085.1 unnamed protein product [Adineta steineri]